MAKWLKSSEFIKFEIAERIARVTLNRPEQRNALSHALLRELHEALLEADDRTDANVIVLEGAGKDFCAGYDLVTTYSDRKADESGASAQEFNYRSLAATIDDDCWQLEATRICWT